MTGTVIVLWSVPRSRSTAFFRMMLQRGDHIAVHEPFSTLAEHGAADVGGRIAHDEAGVVAALRELADRAPVFVKDTTDARYPAVLADEAFLGGLARSAFLIRRPAETIPSYYAVNPRVRSEQIGFTHLRELFERVRSLTGTTPPVIDAEDLVAAPETTVARFCALLGLRFLPEAMTWPAGDRPEWQATRRWHADVARSTALTRRPPSHAVDLDAVPHLAGYLAHHEPVYRELRRHRIRPAGERL
ncbi:sulfotransferase family protein [Micromonospora robiginosa]|uniref:Uncharacterized protein n=1 Tax=Micromonospora robiginosa TaxID=2749844 RepID=A0A7L6B443_9ACTN|nr:sulfotransferase family protein [Micromonospora ferruginea]QLQ36664.1 hypothetical protein H1D33_25915 [Micromonospora ferruginea]